MLVLSTAYSLHMSNSTAMEARLTVAFVAVPVSGTLSLLLPANFVSDS